MFDVILYISTCIYVLNCGDLSFRPYAHPSVTVLKFVYVINGDDIILIDVKQQSRNHYSFYIEIKKAQPIFIILHIGYVI